MNIRKNLVTFLSLVIFTILGISCFNGISSGVGTFKASTNEALRVNKLGHFQLSTNKTTGYSDNDVTKFKDLDFIDEAEGFIESYTRFTFNDTCIQGDFISITNTINKITLVEGNLPSADNEIAIEYGSSKSNKIKIGDTITLKEKLTPLATTTNFKVTAIIQSPKYISNTNTTYGDTPTGGYPIDAIFYLPYDSFKLPINAYTSILLFVDKLKNEDYFSTSFRNKIEALADKLTDSGKKESTDVVIKITDSSAIQLASTAIEILEKMKYSISIVFLIIAILICYITLSRLILKQAPLIGTKKALGMSDNQIRAFYFAFTLIATFSGIILGTILGLCAIQPIMFNLIKSNFSYAAFIYSVPPIELALSIIAVIFFIVLATILASSRLLKKDAVTLISGNDVKESKNHFYEKSKVFQRMPLLGQLTINKVFNEKKRCLMTFVCVLSCATLIGSGLYLYNNLTKPIKTQFDSYYKFNECVYVQGDKTNEIVNALKDDNIPQAEIYYFSGQVQYKDKKPVYTSFYVPKDNEFYNLIKIRDKNNKLLNDIHSDYLSIAYANYHNIQTNEEVTINDYLGNETKMNIKGIFNHYLASNLIVLSQETFKKFVNKENPYTTNCILINSEGKDVAKLEAKLKTFDAFISLKHFKNVNVETINSITMGATGTAVLYIVMSIVMATTVILNLLFMHIQESKFDALSMMVNGYSEKQCKKFVLSDTIFISILAILIGQGTGILLGLPSIKGFLSEYLYYSMIPSFIPILIGVAISAVVVGVITYISSRRIDKMDINNINL